MPVYMPSGDVPTDQIEIIIAVMGPTGVGKTSFINAASGSELLVGEGLKACTTCVMPSDSFTLADRRILLIDTPGFDDTTVSDIEVLKRLGLFLSTIYEHGYKLGGIIYMHRISDIRVGGASRRSLNMFRKMCGEEALRSVFFVTTMWDHVDPKVAIDREKELATRDEFFKPMLDCGARMHRHDNTAASAQDIVSQLVLGMQGHMTLQLQRELVDDRMNIADTTAGKELLVEQMGLAKKQRAELREVQQQLEEVRRGNDRQSLKELIAERRDLTAQIHKAERECQRLAEEYAVKKQEIHERVAEAVKTLQLEKEARIAADRRLSELMESLKHPCSDKEKVPVDTQETKNPKSKKALWGIGVISLLKVIDIALTLLEVTSAAH